MGDIYLLNKCLNKVQELCDKNYKIEEALKIVKEMYLHNEKAPSLPPKKGKERNGEFNYIITPAED